MLCLCCGCDSRCSTITISIIFIIISLISISCQTYENPMKTDSRVISVVITYSSVQFLVGIGLCVGAMQFIPSFVLIWIIVNIISIILVVILTTVFFVMMVMDSVKIAVYFLIFMLFLFFFLCTMVNCVYHFYTNIRDFECRRRLARRYCRPDCFPPRTQPYGQQNCEDSPYLTEVCTANQMDNPEDGNGQRVVRQFRPTVSMCSITKNCTSGPFYTTRRDLFGSNIPIRNFDRKHSDTS